MKSLKARRKSSPLARILAFVLKPIASVAFYFLASSILVPIQIIQDLFAHRDDDKRWGLTVFSSVFLGVILGFAVNLIRTELAWLAANVSRTFSEPNHFYFLIAALCLPRLWNFAFRPLIEILSPKPMLALNGDEFYRSHAWRNLRYDILRTRGKVCELCGSEQAPMHVDHVKPRSKYPHLALDASNLQVLCADCNIGKGARYEDDFRQSS